MPKLPPGWSRQGGLNIPPGSSYGTEIGKRAVGATAARAVMAANSPSTAGGIGPLPDTTPPDTQSAVSNCEAAAASCSDPDEARLWELKAHIISSNHSTSALGEYERLRKKIDKKKSANAKAQKQSQLPKAAGRGDSGTMVWLLGAGLYLAPLIAPPILILKGATVKVAAGGSVDLWSTLLLLGTLAAGSLWLFASCISGARIKWRKAALIYLGMVLTNSLIATSAVGIAMKQDTTRWGIGKQAYEELSHPTKFPFSTVRRAEELQRLAGLGCPDAKYEVAWGLADDARRLWGAPEEATRLRQQALALLLEANALTADGWINPARRGLSLRLQQELV